MTKEELKQEAEAEADKVIIGSGMDRTSVIHLKHLLVTMYIQGATKVTKELEKENAELKGLVNQYKASKCGSISLVNRNMIMFDQLTKAKELLNEFMRISKASDEDFEHDYSELIGDTEQFLNSEVEK